MQQSPKWAAEPDPCHCVTHWHTSKSCRARAASGLWVSAHTLSWVSASAHHDTSYNLYCIQTQRCLAAEILLHYCEGMSEGPETGCVCRQAFSAFLWFPKNTGCTWPLGAGGFTISVPDHGSNFSRGHHFLLKFVFQFGFLLCASYLIVRTQACLVLSLSRYLFWNVKKQFQQLNLPVVVWKMKSARSCGEWRDAWGAAAVGAYCGGGGGVRAAWAGRVDENDWLLQQHELEKNVLWILNATSCLKFHHDVDLFRERRQT